MLNVILPCVRCHLKKKTKMSTIFFPAAFFQGSPSGSCAGSCHEHVNTQQTFTTFHVSKSCFASMGIVRVGIEIVGVLSEHLTSIFMYRYAVNSCK